MTAIPPATRLPGQDFWDFSLRVYAAPGVQEECLALQERLGLDVNLLLFAAFAGARLGLALSDRDLAELIAETDDWHVSVVRRLRATRTDMKKWSERTDGLAAPAAALRLAVKKAELDAERIEHDMLARWARAKTPDATGARDATLESNVRLVLDHFAKTSGKSPVRPGRLIAAALA
ncbi:MAG: TIGR02444 family protein [Pseudorhodoplanes sp.]